MRPAAGGRAACLVVGLSASAAVAGAQDGAPYRPHVEPASAEAQLALEALEPAAGIRCELFAAEPLLANPVCLYVDVQGAVYVGETFRHFAGVTDMREHMDWLDEDLASRTVADRLAMIRNHEAESYDSGYATEHERVRLLRDTDGDGRADRATVFADGFKDHAAGIGAGLLAYRGEVFYTCIPDLWSLRDLDGDDVADERRVMSSGYGVHVALLGHDLHGLRIGPDRRLYFSSGDRGFHVETAGGVLAHPDSGAVLRCDLDGSNLEVVHGGLRNPQELVFDELGNLFTGDNNSDGGDEARWVNIVPGGDSGWRYPYQWITAPVMRGPWNDEKLWHPFFPEQAAYLVPPIANLAHGPSGLAYDPGTGLPEEYRRHFFLCDFRGESGYSGIHTFETHAAGAFFELGEVKRFVWNTLVTDCDFGPDGRLYFTDWVHGWNKTGKGRVFVASGAGALGESALADARRTRELLAGDWSRRDVDELAVLLGFPDQRVRQEAHFQLAERGVEGLAVLVDAARGVLDAEGVGGRWRRPDLAPLHAIWGLGILGREQPAACGAALATLLDSPDDEVRAQAVRVLGDERLPRAAESALRALGDPSPRVRFFAALAAGRLELAGAIEPLVAVLESSADDPNLRHAAVMGLLGCADEATLVTLARHASARVRTGALLVRRRHADARIAAFLSDEDRALVLEAARAIHDVPIAAAEPALARLRLPSDASAALGRRVLAARLRSGDAAGLERAAARPDLDVALRREALEHLAAWGAPPARDPVLGAWRPLAPRPLDELAGVAARLRQSVLAEGPDELVAPFAQLVRVSGERSLAPALRACCEDTDRSSAARVAALGALEALAAPGLAEDVRRACSDPDGTLRAAALAALERLSPAEALPTLPSILSHGELAERRVAYRILAHSDDARATSHLARQLELCAQDLLPAELALDLFVALDAHGDASLLERARVLRAPRRADPELAPWLDALYGGDPQRGATVFQRADLACVRCHRAGGDEESERIGPDLAGLAGRLARQQMLESIVAPNRRTTPGFASTVLFLRGGGVASGRVLSEEDGVIALLDSEGQRQEVALGDVEERRPDLSAMPEDLPASLTPADMRDLLAYLATL